MHFICRSFIGSPNDSNWSQYWENEPDDPFVVAQKGHLFGLMNLKSSNCIEDISSVGHNFISEINQQYFFRCNDKPDISSSLEKTLSFVSQNSLVSGFDLSLLLIVVFKTRIYFGIYGEGEIILNRSQKISRILSGQINKSFVLSGPIFPNDRIFLSTIDFFQKISWNKIKLFLAEDNIQNIEENFLSILYSFDDQTGLAAALIETEADEIKPDFIADNKKEDPNSGSEFSKKRKFGKINFSSLKKIFIRKPVYVSHIETVQVSRRKKINLLVAIFLLFGLAISSFFGYQKSVAVKTESRYQQFKKDLDKKLSDAFAVRNLNLDSALELAKQSQDIFNRMILLKTHSDELSVYDEKIKSLLSQTGSSSGDKSFLSTFYDTSLIIDNPKFSKIILKNNLLYLFDNSLGRIDTVDIGQKNTKNISNNEKIKSSLGFSDNNGYLFLVDDKTVSLIDKNGVDTKIDFSKMNKNIVQKDIKSWNGAFYLLDSSNSTIWKFNPNSSGFGTGEIWLKNDEKLDNPSSLAINGNIWVLSKNGRIFSFIRGVRENFKQSQIPDSNNARNLVVGIDNGILAFVDGNNFIYVYRKTGDLIAKYNLDDKKILDISLDEKSNSLFVLCSDEKIYKINL